MMAVTKASDHHLSTWRSGSNQRQGVIVIVLRSLASDILWANNWVIESLGE
jgi:hypothetical protein